MALYAIVWQIVSRTQQTANVVTYVTGESPEAARDTAMTYVHIGLPTMTPDTSAQIAAIIQTDPERLT